jgi:hypothetical protein
MDLDEFFDQVGGVASTSQLADYFGISPVHVRAWAADNGVPIIGNAFAFTKEAAGSFGEDADLFESDEDDEDEGDEEEGADDDEDDDTDDEDDPDEGGDDPDDEDV